MIKLIGAMDLGRGIGYENKLLYKSPTDMSYFRHATNYKIVVMGYNTAMSLPNNRLPHRVNVVMSDRDPNEIDIPGSLVKTKQEILKMAESCEIWVIGGERTYKEFLAHAQEIHLTIFQGLAKADTFFPEFESEFEPIKTTPFTDLTVSGKTVVYKRKQ